MNEGLVCFDLATELCLLDDEGIQNAPSIVDLAVERGKLVEGCFKKGSDLIDFVVGWDEVGPAGACAVAVTEESRPRLGRLSALIR